MEEQPSSSEKIDRRVLRTRAALKEAIIALVLEQGYQAVRIHDIAERANVSTATIYLHYNNKEDLLLAALEALYGDLIEQARLMGREAGGPVRDRFPLAPVFFARIREHHDLYRVLMSPDVPASVVNRLRGLLTRIFENAIKKRLTLARLNPGDLPLPPAMLADFMAAGFMSLVVNWLESELPISPEEMGQLTMNLILNGVMGGLSPQLSP